MVLRILAFNTVTELCSVAIMVDHKIYNRNVIAPKLHAEKILPMIHQLLIDSGVTLKSLDCIVFDQGPGSFIGLRIGINIAQGLALGSDLPLIGISSLETLAQGSRRIFNSTYVITTIDAKINTLYWACYTYNTVSNTWICKNGIFLLTTKIIKETMFALDGTWTLVGTGWNNDPELSSYIERSSIIISKHKMYPDAQDMLSLGVRSYKNKKLIDPNKIKPIYLDINLFK